MKKLIMAAVAVLVGAGCFPISIPNYYPLAAGNNWNYAVTTTYTMTGAIDTTYTIYGTTMDSVVGPVTIQGKSGWETQARSAGYSQTAWYVKEGDRILGYESLTDATPSTVLKLPVTDNDHWVADSTPAAGKIEDLVEGSEAVTVTAGQFPGAKRIKTTYENIPNVVSYTWYADGIGEIKHLQTTISDTNGVHTVVQMVLELSLYRVY